MSKGNTFENDWLLHVFQNAAISLIGDATGLPAAATVGSLYVSIHTSTGPGEAGTQLTNECAYGNYDRVAVARTSGGWTVAANACENATSVGFPAATSGSETATYIGVGCVTKATGAGKLLYSGQITSPSGGLAISTGITPSIAAGAFDITED